MAQLLLYCPWTTLQAAADPSGFDSHGLYRLCAGAQEKNRMIASTKRSLNSYGASERGWNQLRILKMNWELSIGVVLPVAPVSRPVKRGETETEWRGT